MPARLKTFAIIAATVTAALAFAGAVSAQDKPKAPASPVISKPVPAVTIKKTPAVTEALGDLKAVEVSPAVQGKLDILTRANIVLPPLAAVRETVTVDIFSPANAGVGTNLSMINVKQYSTKDRFVQFEPNATTESIRSWFTISWSAEAGKMYILDCDLTASNGAMFMRLLPRVGGGVDTTTQIVSVDGENGTAIVLPAKERLGEYEVHVMGIGHQPWTFAGCDITPVG